ncbi:BppU family phage baseplate upper protein [Lachnoclostridium sp. Marseille-P6806]|uniref:BppU family phage baseplate upper protein n=1 Tax=Lachnoclostridium sp. Marseille-P6806 TaxID=2364793 RepID=UPI001030DD46|nr:BppU family phage baseplate upper protein [Lachnoclostridium sp. Marseille-P6806]
MNISYQFIVDLARPQKNNTLLIMQNDSNTRELRFLLYSDGDKVDLSEATAAILTAVTPESHTVVGDCTIVKDEDGKNTNEIRYLIPSAISETAGKTTAVVTIMGDGQQISTFEFYINTRNELYNMDSNQSDDDLSGFRDLLNRSLAAVRKIEEMTEQSALPNPYPIRIMIGSKRYSYNGSETVEVTLGDIENEIARVRQSFQDGCSALVEHAASYGVTPSTNGVADINAAWDAIVKNTKVGTATAADVLTGKTFTNETESGLIGAMRDYGAVTLTPTGNNTAESGEGHYTKVVADGTAAYAAGYASKVLHVVKLGECRANPLPGGAGSWSGNKTYTFDVSEYMQHGITADNIVLRNVGMSWSSYSDYEKYSAHGSAAPSVSLSGNTLTVSCPYAASRSLWYPGQSNEGWRRYEWYTCCDAYLVYYA